MDDYKREVRKNNFLVFGACLFFSYVLWCYQKCESNVQYEFGRDDLKSNVDSVFVVDSLEGRLK